MKNNWKEEFDKEFQTTKDLQLDMNVYHVKTHRIQSHRQDIKDFITSLLEEQKKELIEIIHKQFSYELNGEVLISKYELIDELKHHE